jgi:hypothetical protein
MKKRSLDRILIVDIDAQEEGAEKLARPFEAEGRRSVVPIRAAATG